MSFPQARARRPQFPPRCDAARFSFSMSHLAAVAGFTQKRRKGEYKSQKCHFGALFAPFLACFSPCFGVQMSLSPLLPSAGVHFFLKIKNLRLHAESSTRGLGMAIVEIQTGYSGRRVLSGSLYHRSVARCPRLPKSRAATSEPRCRIARHPTLSPATAPPRHAAQLGPRWPPGAPGGAGSWRWPVPVGLRRNVGARERQERAAETTSHPSPRVPQPSLGLEVAGTRATVGGTDRGPRSNSPRNRPLRWRACAPDGPDDGSLRDGRGASQPRAMPRPRRGVGPGDAPGAEPPGDAGGLRRRARPAGAGSELHGQSPGARLGLKRTRLIAFPFSAHTFTTRRGTVPEKSCLGVLGYIGFRHFLYIGFRHFWYRFQLQVYLSTFLVYTLPTFRESLRRPPGSSSESSPISPTDPPYPAPAGAIYHAMGGQVLQRAPCGLSGIPNRRGHRPWCSSQRSVVQARR